MSVWLTRDAYERLRAELEQLLAAAPVPEGQQSRIRRLREVLDNAVIGEPPPDDGIAEPGMVLTVRFDDDADTETFLLGTRDGGDPGGLEVYSTDSPLGTALAGARQGERRAYTVPSGQTVRVTLVHAVPYE